MAPRFRVWAACHVGMVRKHQEDAVGLQSAEGVRPAAALFEREGRCWAIVADGMGGHAAGEVASELAVAMLSSVLDQIDNPDQVRTCLRLIDDELRISMQRHPEFAGMGTTIVGVILTGDECLAFNLGDSRAYIHSHGELRRLSRDHGADHYLTGFLGGSGSLEPPHVTRFGLQPGAKVLLCTDGLTNMLSDGEIGAMLAAGHAHPAKGLVDAAVNADGHDNVSVVVISYEKSV